LVHPDSVKHILQDDNPNYPKNPFNNGKLKSIIGEGLLTSVGSFWLRQRRLIQPAFHRQRLASLGGVITESTSDISRAGTSQLAMDARSTSPPT